MFPSKSSKTTDLIELNKIKQSDRPLKEYVSFVKQECAKRRHNFSAEEINKTAVSIFINGLENNLFRKALKQQNPKDITSAYEMVKNIKSEGESALFNLNEKNQNVSNNNEIVELKAKVEFLQKMIVDLQRTVLKSIDLRNNRFNNNKVNEFKPQIIK